MTEQERCGWPVRYPHRGWACTAPALHDGPHELHSRWGVVVARAAGYEQPTPAPVRHRGEPRP